MADTPSVSLRKYIKWGDNPPSEPTSTLVLTSPAKNFVDIRVLDIQLPIKDPSDLEWAFAGTSHSTPATDSKPAHTIWKHWIDSKVPIAEEVKDEGDMLPQENGETLESGTMINPATNRLEPYEECWVDVDMQEEQKVGWVVKLVNEGPHDEARGMVIRIGDLIQGVLRQGLREQVVVGQWRYNLSEQQGKCKGWEELVAIGNLDLPVSLLGDARIEEGKKYRSEEGVWECVESWGWS